MNVFTDAPEVLSIEVRILHALPDAPNVDVYASGTLIATNVEFGQISLYKKMPYGEYEIQLYPAGKYDKPLFTDKIYFSPKSSNTVSVITLNNSITFLHLKDASAVSGGSTQSFIRFINLSPNSPLLALGLPNGEELFTGVEYAETTGYYPLSSGIYDFKITISSAEAIYKYLRGVQLENGKFYTIYIIGLYKKSPRLGYILIEDGK
ncbi:MAG: DUF4397 domain-containing protein [Clostridium sp.]